MTYHKFEDLKNRVINTSALCNEIDVILKIDHNTMIKKLNTIEEIMALLLSKMDGFKGLVSAIHPEFSISDQAVSILKQFSESGSSRMIYLENFHQIRCLDSSMMIKVDEFRFIEDDINMLLFAGFISSCDINPNGDRIYNITRNGVTFIKSL